MEKRIKKSWHPWTKRSHRRCMTLMVVLLLLPLVTACVLWALFRDPKYTRIMILMLLANIATIYQIVQYKRVANLFRRHHGKICGNCLFPLEGLDDKGVCPECSHPYEIEKTIQGWQQDLSIRQTSNQTATQPS